MSSGRRVRRKIYEKTDDKFAAGAGNVLCYAADDGICGGEYAGANGAARATAVSYTHLDVYKRQFMDWANS